MIEAGISAARSFLEKRQLNTRRSRATAYADLEPAEALGLWANMARRAKLKLTINNLQEGFYGSVLNLGQVGIQPEGSRSAGAVARLRIRVLVAFFRKESGGRKANLCQSDQRPQEVGLAVLRLGRVGSFRLSLYTQDGRATTFLPVVCGRFRSCASA